MIHGAGKYARAGEKGNSIVCLTLLDFLATMPSLNRKTNYAKHNKTKTELLLAHA